MMTEAEALVTILARTDAIWRPLRGEDWTRPTPTNLYEARTRFADVGVRWTAPGDEAERKRAQRALEVIEAAGLVIVRRGKRQVNVRLTDSGEMIVRSLCGLPNLDQAGPTVREVIELETKPKGEPFAAICSELWLGRLKDYANTARCNGSLWDVQATLLPALCREWVTAESDPDGRAYYSATRRGRAQAKLPAPTLPASLPEYDDQAAALYLDTTREFREALRRAKPNCPGEIGFLPLPASLDIRKPRFRRNSGTNRGTAAKEQ